jgi:hypothetical protein
MMVFDIFLSILDSMQPVFYLPGPLVNLQANQRQKTAYLGQVWTLLAPLQVTNRVRLYYRPEPTFDILTGSVA